MLLKICWANKVQAGLFLISEPHLISKTLVHTSIMKTFISKTFVHNFVKVSNIYGLEDNFDVATIWPYACIGI